jgi:ABC-type sugar transport system permease subunit
MNRKTLKKRGYEEKKWAVIFLAPWIISSVLFLAYPLFLALKNSFLNVNLLEPEKAAFVGFGNIVRAIGDTLFWKSLFNVAYNQVIFISLSLIISLALAVMLKELGQKGAFFRTAYFFPIITSVTVAMLIFNQLSGVAGPIQTLLFQWGILQEKIPWKATRALPMPILALFNVWKWYGISMVIFLGGLYGVEQSSLEAAEIDGAGWWARVFYISLPQIKPQIVFVITINIINGLQMFTEVYTLFDTQGGPYGSALTPVLYLYKTGFRDRNMGYSTALGLVLACSIFCITTLQLKIMKYEEN